MIFLHAPCISELRIYRITGIKPLLFLFVLIIYRERVTLLTTLAENSTSGVTDTEILDFYNLATSKLLTALEVRFNINDFVINFFAWTIFKLLGRSI